MKKVIFLWSVLAIVIFLTDYSMAGSEKWEIDKAHSNIYFEIRHTYATVRGKFEGFSGTVYFKPDDILSGKVRIDVKTASINTGIAKRDNHLRSDDFFNVKAYPDMTFQSTGIRHKERNKYTLEGKLTIKGITREVVMPFTYMGMQENPLKKGEMIAGFETQFSLDRLDYKVGTGKFLEMGVVGNQVDVLVTLELLKHP